MICGHKHHLCVQSSLKSVFAQQSSAHFKATQYAELLIYIIFDLWTQASPLRSVSSQVSVCLAEFSIILAYTQYTYLLI
jgi:hypothetical protein